MGAWVRRLSPGWFAFLAGCRSKPLVRDAGLAMTWGEVQMIERGGAVPDCDRIAFRNKEWLFARRS